jgi:hypothetical protein
MATNSVDAQVTLPTELYQTIQKMAEQKGHSLNDEIVTLLMISLTTEIEALEEEFALWEIASDEDWLNTESKLRVEEL